MVIRKIIVSNNITGQTAESSCKTCLSGYVALLNGSTSCSICNKGL